jgi:hypothetical protein
MTKIKICAYCGKENPKTRDHIPLRGLFPKPWPKDLITVPCCDSCHDDSSDDDLYFRTVLLTASNLSADNMAIKQMDHAIKSLNRPNRSKLANLIRNSIIDTEIVTEAGLIIGNWPAMKIDHDKIEKVLIRIVRGLFFREFRVPLPKDCNVFAKIDQFGKDASVLSKEGCFCQAKWAADNLFGYTYARAIDKEDASVWLGVFYQQVTFIGFTGIPNKL